MSTDLYGVRILDVDREQRRMRVRVFVVYYDVAYKQHQPIPTADDLGFFFRILWEQGGCYPYDQPIQRAISDTLSHHEGFVSSNAYRFIEEVEVLKLRNHPVSRSRWKELSDFYYERDGAWKDEERLVQGDYDVWVSDPEWLDGITQGSSWGTTAYTTEDDPCTLEDALNLPDLRLARTRLEPFAGEQEASTPERAIWSPDSRYLLVLSQAGALVLYQVEGWQELWRHETDQYWPECGFSPDGAQVWVKHPALCFDTLTGQPSTTPPPQVFARYASPQWTYQLEYGGEYSLDCMGQDPNKPLWSIPHPDCVEAVTFTQDERLMAFGGMSNIVRLWSMPERVELKTFEVAERVMALAFSPDGRYLIVCYGSHHISILRVEDGRVLRRLGPWSTRDYIYPVAWSPDGRFVALTRITGHNGYDGYFSIHEIGATWTLDDVKR